ncbi:MAG: serine/threonine protein kinase [Candidatus Hydrogenedentes bacterium]|nr:serine/threonine protein kinase [Candidatus Hydrogenedentota bacterium]
MQDEMVPPRPRPNPEDVETRVVPGREKQKPAESDAGSAGESADAAPAALNSGTRIGDYEVERVLGEGGFGTVYLGTDTKLGRPVALKFLRDTMDPRRRKLFDREARAIAALGKHPSIVQIYASGEHEGHAYFALEHVGSNALKLLEEQPNGLPVNDALRIAAECAEALAYAHREGILHRDVKPANILIEPEDGRAKLADFGLARFYESGDSSMSGLLSGSPSYMSPEQAQSERVDKRTDVFSLGVTLYQLLCGRKPFEGRSPMDVLDKIRADKRIPLRSRRPDLPEAVLALVEKATAHDLARRFQSADELAQALRALLAPAGSASAWDTTTVDLQRAEARKTAEDIVCSVCQTKLVSPHLVKGQCSETGAPICYKCWAAGHRTSAAAPPAEAAAVQASPEEAAHDAAVPPAKEPAPVDSVRLEQAKSLETLFIQGMAHALRKADTWPGPRAMALRGLESAAQWQGEPPKETGLTTRAQRMALHAHRDRLPRNRGVRMHAVFGRRLLGLFPVRQHVFVDVLNAASLSGLLDTSRDAEPASAAELAEALERRDRAVGAESAGGKAEHIALAFSPTGWAEALPVPDGVVLIDAGGAGAWQARYGAMSEPARAFVEALCDAEGDKEKVERCCAAIAAESNAQFPLSAADIAAREGVALDTAVEAFRQLAAKQRRFVLCQDPERDDWLLDLR